MSNVTLKPQYNFQEVIDRANRELQNTSGTPFSEPAFEQLKQQIGTYAVELINESVKKAKRHQAEGVSSSDVQQASQYLVASTSHRIYRHAGSLGGLLLGTALANTLSMIYNTPVWTDGHRYYVHSHVNRVVLTSCSNLKRVDMVGLQSYSSRIDKYAFHGPTASPYCFDMTRTTCRM